jgi:hypothetical protein
LSSTLARPRPGSGARAAPSRRRTCATHFEVPHCDELGAFEIDWVRDNVTGADDSALPSDRFERTPLLTDARGLRACFDRRKLLVDALAQRGIPLRTDSRTCSPLGNGVPQRQRPNTPPPRLRDHGRNKLPLPQDALRPPAPRTRQRQLQARQTSVFPTIGFNLPGSPQRFAKVGSLRRSCWGA